MDEKRFPVSVDLGVPESAPAPEPPPAGAFVWVKENLFSSVANSLLSIAIIAALLASLSGIAAWALEGTRQWRAVAQNSRLLMIQAYPQDAMWRVWASVGVIVVLAGLSVAAYRVGDKISRRQLGRIVMGTSGFLFVTVLVAAVPYSLNRVVWLVVFGAVFMGTRFWVDRQGENATEESISTLALMGLALLGVVASLWVMRAPVPGVNEQGFNADVWEPIALSTKLPWTILAGVGLLAYWLGVLIRDRFEGLRAATVAGWTLASPFIVMILLRAPDLAWTGSRSVLTLDVPILLAFGVGGGVLVSWLGTESSGEPGRAVAGLIFLGGLIALFLAPVLMVVKLLVLTLGLFGLLAPNFGGSPQARRQLVAVWFATVFLIVLVVRLSSSESALGFGGSDFLGGLALTFVIAIFGIGLSFPLGVILALGRTSTLPIFRTVSTVYIELVRSVPLITWLFASLNLFPLFLPGGLELDQVVRAVGAVTLFSAAYLAENVRGGLQSLSKGQYEAADALGMTTIQKTSLIILPQALKAVIPALVGQVIALFKDTSLVAIIGLFDLLYIAQKVIPSQSQFLGSFLESIVAVAVLYWVFTFAFYRASMRLERRMGVGQR